MRESEEIKIGMQRCLHWRCKQGDDRCPYFSECLSGDGRRLLLTDAMAYIEQLEANQMKWISVKDRMPKGGSQNAEDFCEIINLVTKEGDVTSGWINGYEGFAYLIRGDNDYISRVPIAYVEYWMPLQKHPRHRPLPEPPKED